jgi:hypothetical protein
MAYVYSTAQSNSSYGNRGMTVNIYRGTCTRTQTSVSFSFGVSFAPDGESYSWSSNSVAAWYGGKQRFANVTRGSNDKSSVYGKNTYHAYYTDRSKSGNYKSEYLCFSYSNTAISATTTSVSITVGLGWADWAGTQKGTLTFSLSIPEWHETAVKGSTTITDHYNNTFTLSASKGPNKINNDTTLKNLAWSYDSATYGTTFYNGEVVTNDPIGNHSYKNQATRPVYARSYTDPEVGNDLVATASINLLQFYVPSAPTNVTLHYNKNRFTIKEPWKFTWTASTTANTTTSPIKGYQITLYKNNEALTGLVYDSANKKITLGTDTNTYVNTESKATEVTIDPIEFGYLAGDTVWMTVAGYTQWSYRGSGKPADTTNGVWKFSDAGSLAYFNNESMHYEDMVVQNAGVVRIKTSNGWKEGQVWVKTGDVWVEADTVKIKTDDGWKESE